MADRASLVLTADGSHTLLSARHQVAYHSRFGAIQETEHVFIQSGLLPIHERGQPLHILELGLGTGLNAFMTFLRSNELQTQIRYTSLEPEPISWHIASQLNYLSQLEASSFSSVFRQMHCGAFDSWLKLGPFFSFRKIKKKIADYHSDEKYSLVYYDAFAPDTQPELWTEDCFRRVYNTMDTPGVLVTYCAKGSVKRALKAAGFEVESIAGPPGKREMIRAGRGG